MNNEESDPGDDKSETSKDSSSSDSDIPDDDSFNRDVTQAEQNKFDRSFKAYKLTAGSQANEIKDKIVIIEGDYVANEKLVISDDVYNLTIAANMTKSLPPNQLIFCIR